MATTGSRATAIGVFRTQDEARDAIRALRGAGFAAGDISLLAADRGEARELASETGTHTGEGAATGIVAGGILGGLGGWLVGIGALAIPGVGPFIAAGAFGAALTGAAVGAGVGVIAGALIGMGLPREEADWYEREVKGGGTLVAVRAGGRYAEAHDLLHRHGAYDVEHRDGMPAGAGATNSETPGGTYGAGPRPLLDDVTPAERMAASTPGGATDTVLRGDYPQTSLGSGMTTTTATHSSDATTVDTGTAARSGAPTAPDRWEDAAPAFRQAWGERYAPTGGGGRWEDAEPAYRYGWEASRDPRYEGRSYEDVEPELRREWGARYPNAPWDVATEAIREAWNRPARR